jgi:imidazolonepropionase
VPKTSDNWDQVWIGANIATMAGSGAYGSIHDAALAIKGERIAWLGAAEEGRRLAQARGASIHEVRGQWITPGLIDCHTHLVYGGNRVAEFEQRLCGASYEEIARAGGGIQSTMRETRAATQETLYESALARLKCLMA